MATERSAGKDSEYFYMVIDQSLYDLNFLQQEFIQKNIDNFTVVELMRETYKDPSLNERNVEYDKIRKYVAKLKRNAEKIKFSPAQIEFIDSNAGQMKAFELAKNIFPDKKIAPLSTETQAISEYIKAVGLSLTDNNLDTEYKPPRAVTSIVKKINNADINANLDPNDLSPFHRKCVDSLKAYFNSIRFCSFMRLFEEKEMRELFEEEFVKATYDKPDLNSEELNMYINLCTEYVNIHQISKNKNILEVKINQTLADDGEDAKKLYMTWVDLLNKREQDLNNTKKRAEGLQIKLSSTRASRLEKQAQVNESLSKFVEAWKSEEGRARGLRIAEAQNLLVKEEVKRLENMDEYIVNVMGVSLDEITRN